LNPYSPSPDYFEGLAALFDGRIVEALKLWQGLLDTAPKEARWKPRLESQLSGVMQMAEQLSKSGTSLSTSN
jgi:cytochrome c-type biogenesis protein CcmH